MEASAHSQPGQFDISLFWRNYYSLVQRTEDTMIIGITGGVSLFESKSEGKRQCLTY